MYIYIVYIYQPLVDRLHITLATNTYYLSNQYICYSPGEVCKNCSDGDKSMKICPYVLWTVLIILRYGGN